MELDEKIKQLIPKMKEMVERTKKTGLEHGFIVCEAPHRIEEFIGKKNSIELGNCRAGEKMSIMFHTHPSGLPIPSHVDEKISEKLGAEINCIGTDEGIFCIIKKGGRVFEAEL